MSRTRYYEDMKALALRIRSQYQLDSPRVLRGDLRRIYKDQGIKIDLWPRKFRGLKGAYFNDDIGAMVMLAKDLPEDPMVFTMAHELKHHLVDQGRSVSFCDNSNSSEEIEIGAEIFAAELIYPETDFAAHLAAMNVSLGGCTAETLVRLKRTQRTTLSYAGLAKRAEFLRLAPTIRSRIFAAGENWKKRSTECRFTKRFS